MEPSDSACRRAVHFTQLAITLPHEKGQPAALTDDPRIHTLSLMSSSSAAALLFARGIPLLPLRLRRIQPSALFLFPSLGRTSFCTATDSYEKVASAAASDSTAVCSSKDPSQYFRSDHPDYRRWKDKEEEILKDIEPITFHIKQILHSTRYPKKSNEIYMFHSGCGHDVVLVQEPSCPN